MVDSAAASLGGLDVLVNNAGVFFAHPIDEVDYETWQQAWADTLGVNLVGAANVTWCALQHMPRESGSRIVNVGSRGAYRGEPDIPAYGASKAGLHAFGQSMAQRLAPRGIASEAPTMPTGNARSAGSAASCPSRGRWSTSPGARPSRS